MNFPFPSLNEITIFLCKIIHMTCVPSIQSKESKLVSSPSIENYNSKRGTNISFNNVPFLTWYRHHNFHYAFCLEVIHVGIFYRGWGNFFGVIVMWFLEVQSMFLIINFDVWSRLGHVQTIFDTVGLWGSIFHCHACEDSVSKRADLKNTSVRWPYKRRKWK